MCLYLYKETSEVYTEMNCVYISFVGEIVTHTHTQLVFRFPNRPNVIGSSFDLNASQDTSLKKIKYIYEKSRRYKCKTTRNEIGSFFMFSTEIDKLLLKKWSINTNYITKKKFTILLLLILDFFFVKKWRPTFPIYFISFNLFRVHYYLLYAVGVLILFQ